jgi:hypothetical protein
MVVQPWGRCFHISTMTTYIDAVFTVETLPNGVYRAGADIPENDPQSGERKLRQTAFLFGLRALTVGLFQGRFFSPSWGMVIPGPFSSGQIPPCRFHRLHNASSFL